MMSHYLLLIITIKSLIVMIRSVENNLMRVLNRTYSFHTLRPEQDIEGLVQDYNNCSALAINICHFTDRFRKAFSSMEIIIFSVKN